MKWITTIAQRFKVLSFDELSQRQSIVYSKSKDGNTTEIEIENFK